MGRFTPTQNDLKDLPRLERTMRIVFDELYRTPQSISEAIAGLEKRLPTLIGNNLSVVQQGLQADGTAPLNLTALPGIPAQVSQILQDTHANRLTLYPASNYPNSAFYETDRDLVYVSTPSGGTNVWQYVTGISFGTNAARWADLTTTDDGVYYVESDRNNLLYRWSGTAWAYIYGIWSRTKAQKLAGLGLGTADAGLLILQTDELALFQWSGTAYTLLATFPFSDTHNGRYATGTVDTAGTAVSWVSGAVFNTSWAGRHMTINGVLYTIASVASTTALTLSSTAGVQAGVTYYGGYFSVDLVPGVQFFETDRQYLYQTATSSGTVTPNGTTIDWTSGDTFSPTWVGATIVIDGTDYTVATYVSSIQLTVTSTAGTPGAVAFSVKSGKWLWVSGQGASTQANLPTDLLTTDAGALWAVTDYMHLLQWTGAAWDWSESDAGSRYIVMGTPTGAPNQGLWGACDGTAYAVLNANGTTSNITTPNLTGEVYIKGSTAFAAQQAAARATWEASAVTNTESAHTHGIGTYAAAAASTGVTVDSNTTGISIADHSTAADTAVTGAGTRVTTANHVITDGGHNHAVTDPQHTHTLSGTSGAGSAHQHVLNDANAQLKVFSEANGGVPLRISTVWYMRR